jgi:hypothetical protein
MSDWKKTYHVYRCPGTQVVYASVTITNNGFFQPAYDLPKRFDLRNHSPTGFEFGFEGSGPAQLALALLADAFGDDYAREAYQEFKREVIAHLVGNGHHWFYLGRPLHFDLTLWRGQREVRRRLVDAARSEK